MTLRSTRRAAMVQLAAFAARAATEPRDTTHSGQPAVLLSNDRLRLTVLTQGSTIASLTLNDDDEQLNPFWTPTRPLFDNIRGHFIALDGFGDASAEERAAGLHAHGEARFQQYSTLPRTDATSASLTMNAILPAAGQSFTRTYSIVDGESVIHVSSRVENTTAADRPLLWTEHPTFGPPFMAPGVSAIDIPGGRAKVRPLPPILPESALGRGANLDNRLTPGSEFDWPGVAGASGRAINLRGSPGNPRFLEHIAVRFDPSRDLAWVIALNTFRQSALGYVFRRADFPWVQLWGYFPGEGTEVRGAGFGLSPWDLPRRDALRLGEMFGAPTFGWLPARSRIEKQFLLFATRTPDGFRRVDDVQLAAQTLTLTDRISGLSVRLNTSRGLGSTSY